MIICIFLGFPSFVLNVYSTRYPRETDNASNIELHAMTDKYTVSCMFLDVFIFFDLKLFFTTALGGWDLGIVFCQKNFYVRIQNHSALLIRPIKKNPTCNYFLFCTFSQTLFRSKNIQPTKKKIHDEWR